MSKRCEDCSHFQYDYTMWEHQCIKCELTNTILKAESAETCKLYNKDLSEYDICVNCKYFGGGGDWGLACAKHYHRLPHALDDACDDMERRK